MEVTVSSADGLSEDNIVSIRLGETRRQAPLHKLRKQPFRFPTCEEAMSIEVMQVVASCRIALLPAKVDYWIPLTDGTGARNDVTSTANSSMCIGMHVQFPGSSDLSFNTSGTGVAGSCPTCYAPSTGLPAYQNAAIAARDYLEKHAVLQYIQSLLHAIIQEKPADPFSYMSQQLLASASATPVETTEPTLQPDAVQRPNKRQPGEDLQANSGIGIEDPGLSHVKNSIKTALFHAEVNGRLDSSIDEVLTASPEPQQPQATKLTEQAAQGSADDAPTDLLHVRSCVLQALLDAEVDGRLDRVIDEALPSSPEECTLQALLNAEADGRLARVIDEALTVSPEQQQAQSTTWRSMEQTKSGSADAA